jgi:hypothetical protein
MRYLMRIVESEYIMFFSMENIIAFEVDDSSDSQELYIRDVSGKVSGFCDIGFKSFGDNDGDEVQMNFELRLDFVRIMLEIIYGCNKLVLTWPTLEEWTWEEFLRIYGIKKHLTQKEAVK